MCPCGKREDIPEDIRRERTGDHIDLHRLIYRMMVRIFFQLLQTPIACGELQKGFDPFSIVEIGAPVPQQKKDLHGHLLRHGAVLQQHRRKGKEFRIVFKKKHLERFGASLTKIRKRDISSGCFLLADHTLRLI
jgi:hypothetical protein